MLFINTYFSNARILIYLRSLFHLSVYSYSVYHIYSQYIHILSVYSATTIASHGPARTAGPLSYIICIVNVLLINFVRIQITFWIWFRLVKRVNFTKKRANHTYTSSFKTGAEVWPDWVIFLNGLWGHPVYGARCWHAWRSMILNLRIISEYSIRPAC